MTSKWGQLIVNVLDSAESGMCLDVKEEHHWEDSREGLGDLPRGAIDLMSAAAPTFNLFIYSNWWVTQLPFTVTLPGGVWAEQGSRAPLAESPSSFCSKDKLLNGNFFRRMRLGRLSLWASWSRQSVLPLINRDTRWSGKSTLLKCVGKMRLGHLSSLSHKAMEGPEGAATPAQSNRSNSAGPALQLVL